MGPRDFIINLIINGVIASFVFPSDQSVLLAGSDTIFKMLLPMSFIESTLTSFFGFLGGTQEIRKQTPHPDPIRWSRWFVFAVGFSLIRGLIALGIFATVMSICRWMALSVSIPGSLIAITVGLISGLLAYVLHSTAVVQSEALLERCKYSKDAALPDEI